jgi:hypothetical protein
MNTEVHHRTGHEGPEVEVDLYFSLTWTLDGVGGQRDTPAALPQGKRPGTHCIGGWARKISPPPPPGSILGLCSP